MNYNNRIFYLEEKDLMFRVFDKDMSYDYYYESLHYDLLKIDFTDNEAKQIASTLLKSKNLNNLPTRLGKIRVLYPVILDI